MSKKLKPKAYSMGIGDNEILYKCRKCDFKFTMAGEKWHYCPQCATGIDWGVITRANEEWKQKFYSVMDDNEKCKEMLDILDKANEQIEGDCRHEMTRTVATEKAIRKSNIQYYLGIGWTKKQLIDKGFTEQDFEEIE